MAVQNALKVKVAGAPQQDVGKGIVRLNTRTIRALGLEKGNIVEIRGKRTTAAITVPTQVQAPEDGAELIRMDGLIRNNAGVGIGDFVEIAKAEWTDAKKVVVAPARPGLLLSGSGEALRPTLLYRPLVQGDLISTSIFHQGRQSFPSDFLSDDIFRAFFESPAFGLMEIRLVLARSAPRGIVRGSEIGRAAGRGRVEISVGAG